MLRSRPEARNSLRAGLTARWMQLDRALDRAMPTLDQHVRRCERGFPQLRARFAEDLWRGVASELEARFEDLGAGFYRLSRGSASTVVHGSALMVDNVVSYRLAGHKPLSLKLLEQAGLGPLPQGRLLAAERWTEALPMLEQGPVVVKPAADSGAGRGVSTYVCSEEQLRTAVRAAARCDSQTMIEPQVEGHSYRLLYLDGELISAIRRERPRVTGDGKHTIRELMRAETEARLGSDTPRALSPLQCDLDARNFLEFHGLHVQHRLSAGHTLPVKGACNQNSAQDNVDITGRVCPEVEELGRQACATLQLRFAGVDLIAPTLDVPLAASGGVINELNTTPGLHHHYLIRGGAPRRGPAAIVVERLLEDAQ